MATIKYNAKRDIVTTGFRVSATDISAAVADSSFNSLTTSLAGVSNNEWFKLSGFSTTANNGWFQANADSIATKITQDTSSGIQTEAAGNTVTIVGYERGYGQEYTLEFDAERLDRRMRHKRHRHEPIGGGRPETLLLSREPFWEFTTDILEEADMPQWREFLASVAADELFTFDPYGSVAAADNPLLVVLESEDLAEDREGASRLYRFALRVKVIGEAPAAAVASGPLPKPLIVSPLYPVDVPRSFLRR